MLEEHLSDDVFAGCYSIKPAGPPRQVSRPGRGLRVCEAPVGGWSQGRLSLVRLHRPDVDVAAIAAGPPAPPAGSAWNMVPHYQAVDRPAEEIVDFFEEQTNVLLRH